MPDTWLRQIGREMFLAALGIPLHAVDSWVIDRLIGLLYEQEVHAGQRLMRAGEPVKFVYFLNGGRIQMTRDDAPSWTYSGRWLIGGNDAIGDRVSTRDATALTDFRAMTVPAASWVELHEDSFKVARSGVINTARSVALMEQRIPTRAPLSPHLASRASDAPPGALSMIERLALLLDLRMLRGVGVQVLANLAAASRQVGFAPGEALCKKGDEPSHLLCLVDGEVRAERGDPSVFRTYGPGDLVCGAATLGGVADAWEATATAATRTISIPLEAIFDQMEEHFDLVRATTAALAARRELLYEHLAAESGELVLT